MMLAKKKLTMTDNKDPWSRSVSVRHGAYVVCKMRISSVSRRIKCPQGRLSLRAVAIVEQDAISPGQPTKAPEITEPTITRLSRSFNDMLDFVRALCCGAAPASSSHIQIHNSDGICT